MGRNAVLSFGLVNVPVGVETTAKRQDYSFKTLHRDCGTPIHNAKFCDVCDRVVETTETIKGYEYAKGQFLNLEPEELERVQSPRSSVIEIAKFVPSSDMSPLMRETTYWLRQNDTLKEPYVLLLNAIESEGVVGIGHAALWGKECPVAVDSMDGVLYLSTLFCDGDYKEVEQPQMPDLRPGNVELAANLVKAMSGSLDKEDLVSTARERTHQLIQSRMAGEKLPEPEKEPDRAPTTDIQETLRMSIELIRDPKARAAAEKLGVKIGG